MTYHLSRLCFWLVVPRGKIALNEEKYFQILVVTSQNVGWFLWQTNLLLSGIL